MTPDCLTSQVNFIAASTAHPVHLWFIYIYILYLSFFFFLCLCRGHHFRETAVSYAYTTKDEKYLRRVSYTRYKLKLFKFSRCLFRLDNITVFPASITCYIFFVLLYIFFTLFYITSFVNSPTYCTLLFTFSVDNPFVYLYNLFLLPCFSPVSDPSGGGKVKSISEK